MSTFTTASAAKAFALAGRAHLTLTSMASGVHFTFRITQAKGGVTGKPVATWFVSLLVDGSADDGTFAYMGMINASHFFRRTAKSRVGEDAPSFKAFNFFWTNVTRGCLPAMLKVQHEGRCGRCNRTLTHPESIESGFGPECIGKIGALLCEAA